MCNFMVLTRKIVNLFKYLYTYILYNITSYYDINHLKLVYKTYKMYIFFHICYANLTKTKQLNDEKI